MPPGPEEFVEHPGYAKEFAQARELLLSHPVRWRVVYHYDGDGIASASAALRALNRLGYPLQATPLVGVERQRMEEIVKATKGPMLILDTGASWLDLFATHREPVIVLDHHRYPGVPEPPALPHHLAFVNPLDWGVDGMTELCAATLTWLFTVFLDPKNWDNAAWGLSGAIADRQHVGGFHGLNGRLLAEARSRSLVEPGHGLPLLGPNLGEALARSIDPYLVGVSGRPEEARRLLRGLAIDPDLPTRALPREQEAQLAGVLKDRLRAQGARPEFVESVEQERWHLPGLDMDAQELSNLQNASGRIGEPGVGIALALGDSSALERTRTAEATWRSGILRGLTRIEKEGVNEMRALQWFESQDTTLAGTQAGLAMNYLLDSRRPVFAFSPGSDGTKVSGRGTRWLVDQGLDLSAVLRTAAQLVHGEGGGHRVASGATIPPTSREAFLQEADRLIAEQLPLPLLETAR